MNDPTEVRFPELPLSERNRLALRWTPKGVPALLDAGCAWGYGTRFFATRAARVAGIDVNAESIAVARERYPQMDFRVAPLEQIPHPDGAFHAVVCLDVLEHVQDERRAVAELFRVLRPGGTLILSTPHPGAFAFLDLENVLRRFGRMDVPEHRHYSLADLHGLLDGRFEEVQRHRSGLLAYPLGVWASWLSGNPRLSQRAGAALRRGATAAIEVDYLIPYGPLSYCIALKLRKR